MRLCCGFTRRDGHPIDTSFYLYHRRPNGVWQDNFRGAFTTVHGLAYRRTARKIDVVIRRMATYVRDADGKGSRTWKLWKAYPTRHLSKTWWSCEKMGKTDDRVTKLFTKKSHHCNMSVVYLLQNLFSKGKEHRTINLNAQYMVLFKNPRDTTVVSHLAKQMYPGDVRYMQEAFKEATSRPYGYLLVDLKHETPEHLRLPTNVLSR